MYLANHKKNGKRVKVMQGTIERK